MERATEPHAVAILSVASMLRTLAAPPPEKEVLEAIRWTLQFYHHPAPRLLFLPSPVVAARFVAHLIALAAGESVASAWAKGLCIEEDSETERAVRTYTGALVRGHNDLRDSMSAATSVMRGFAGRQPIAHSGLLLRPDTTSVMTETLRQSERLRSPARSFIRRYHGHFLHSCGGSIEALSHPEGAFEFAFYRYALRGAIRSILRHHSNLSWAQMPSLLQLDLVARSCDVTTTAMRCIRDLWTILTGCFLFIELRSIILLVRPPVSTSFDAAGRMHCEDGPALTFADGSNNWGLEDNVFDLAYLDGTAPLTAPEIAEIDDQRRRRLLIERYGGLRGAPAWDKWLTDLGAECLDQDPLHGDLFAVQEHLNLAFLRVRCPSKGDIHHLHVPHEMISARDARAWTFGVPREFLDGAVET